MTESIFEPVIRALEDARVRYVVVGGLAVVLQGHARLTVDLDVAIDLENDSAAAVEALTGLGLVPRAPVDPAELADPGARSRWVQEKGMTVLSFWDPAAPLRVVDIFVENPIAFEEMWDRSEIVPLSTTGVRIASIADLIRMKEAAGRPHDLQDVAALREIARRRGTHG